MTKEIGMKEYLITGEATISVHVTVKATSKADALLRAAHRGMQSFCASCSKGDADEWSTTGSLDVDGEVVNLRVEDP